MNLHRERAEAALQLRRFELAEREAAAGLNDAPDDPELLAIQSRALFGQGRLKESLAVAKTVVSLNPAWGYGHHLLAVVYYQRAWLASYRGDGDESEECLECAQQAAEIAIQCGPDEPTFLANAALVELFQGHVAAALALSLAGLEIDPEHADSLEAAAHAWFADGAHIRALEVAKRGLSIDPENARLHTVTAEILADLGNFDEALLHSRNAVQFDPNDLRAWAVHRENLKSRIWLLRPLFAIKLKFDHSRAFCMLYCIGSLISGPLIFVALSAFLSPRLNDRWLWPAIGCSMLLFFAGAYYQPLFALISNVVWALIGGRIERRERDRPSPIG